MLHRLRDTQPPGLAHPRAGAGFTGMWPLPGEVGTSIMRSPMQLLPGHQLRGSHRV